MGTKGKILGNIQIYSMSRLDKHPQRVWNLYSIVDIFFSAMLHTKPGFETVNVFKANIIDHPIVRDR